MFVFFFFLIRGKLVTTSRTEVWNRVPMLHTLMRPEFPTLSSRSWGWVGNCTWLYLSSQTLCCIPDSCQRTLKACFFVKTGVYDHCDSHLNYKAFQSIPVTSPLTRGCLLSLYFQFHHSLKLRSLYLTPSLTSPPWCPKGSKYSVSQTL